MIQVLNQSANPSSKPHPTFRRRRAGERPARRPARDRRSGEQRIDTLSRHPANRAQPGGASCGTEFEFDIRGTTPRRGEYRSASASGGGDVSQRRHPRGKRRECLIGAAGLPGLRLGRVRARRRRGVDGGLLRWETTVSGPRKPVSPHCRMDLRWRRSCGKRRRHGGPGERAEQRRGAAYRGRGANIEAQHFSSMPAKGTQ